MEPASSTSVNGPDHASKVSETPESRKRGEDHGEALLPGMTQFALLARKVKQPVRLMQLIGNVCKSEIPQDLLQDSRNAKAALTPGQRTKLYTWLSNTQSSNLSLLEKVCTRITALTDIFGHQAVLTLLELQDEEDAQALAEPTDKWSRALYLYNGQFNSDAISGAVLQQDGRFEQAERRQSMNQHWNSREYASHFLGPKDAAPLFLAEYQQTLREQVAALYPGINPDLIVIDHHCKNDVSHSRRHGNDDKGADVAQHQHTIAATFNATRAQYRTVVGQSVKDAQVVEVDQPAAIEVIFSWEPATGMLGVFCPDTQHRATLATVFQQTVLGQTGLPSQVPMCSFDLQAFGNASVLTQISSTLVEGVQDVAIQKIRLSNPIATEISSHAVPARSRIASNSLQISRHSRDLRDIYKVSSDVYRLPMIEGKDISHVTLSLVMKDQPDCKAHRVAVHVARPNSLTHGCKSALDRKIMQQQLCALGVMNLVSN
jgi:hypothetical protein